MIVGGCCVLVALLRRFGFDEMLVSEADILDGLALSLAVGRVGPAGTAVATVTMHMPLHRPGPDGPGALQPLPRGGRGPGPPDARSPRPRVRRPCSTRPATGCARCSAPPTPLTLPISAAPARPGMEAAFVNLVAPGRPGRRRGQRRVRRAHVRRGRPLRRRGRARSRRRGASRSTPSALLGAHPAPAVIAVVHAETSTGVRNDIAPLGAGKGDALLLVDCVTIARRHRGRRRRLGRRHRLRRHAEVPGRAARAWRRSRSSERARERLVERSPQLVPRPAHDRPVHGPGHRRPHLPPHGAGLDDLRRCTPGSGAVLDEGLDAAVARHAECGRAAAGRAASAGLRAVRGRGPPAARADHGVGARRRRRRRGAGRRCSTATASRSAAGSASSPAGCGASAAWATPPGPRNVDAAARRAGRADRRPDDRAHRPPGRRCARSSPTDFAGVAGGAPAQRRLAHPWEPARNPEPARRGRVGARRSPCAAAPASGSASSAPGSGSASSCRRPAPAARAVLRRDQPVLGAAGTVPVGLRRLLDRPGPGRPRLHARGAWSLLARFAFEQLAPAPHPDRRSSPATTAAGGSSRSSSSATRASPSATSRSTACGRTTSATRSPSRSGTTGGDELTREWLA